MKGLTGEIVVNINPHETRLALSENGVIKEIYIEKPEQYRIAGNVYKGRVANVLPGMQAAFIDIGLEKNAFLYVDNVVPLKALLDNSIKKTSKKNKAIKDMLHIGQEVIVQITKEPMGTKGARVTSRITLPGRYMVLMPLESKVGISHRIENETERNRLKNIGKAIRPHNMGIIIRTVAADVSEEELIRDRDFLLKLWKQILAKAKTQHAPALLHHEVDLIYRTIRDMFNENIQRLVIDDYQEYQKVLDILKYTAPDFRERVYLYTQPRPIFEAFDVENEIKKALKRKIWLKCGGYLIIDKTEALTSIDVNTGKFVGSKNLDDTILKTNIEAAREIARQVRLRDLGGIIIIDFIDMHLPQHQEKVIETLKEATIADRTKVVILGLTRLGLVEMTRKKVSHGLSESLQKVCPQCEGSGRVISEEAMSSFIEIEIKKYFNVYNCEAILVEVNPQVAAVLIGAGGSNLKRLEKETGRTIFIRGSEFRSISDWIIVSSGSVENVQNQALPIKQGDLLTVVIEERHQTNPNDGIARIDGYVLHIVGGGSYVGKRVRLEVIRAYRTYGKTKIIT